MKKIGIVFLGVISLIMMGGHSSGLVTGIPAPSHPPNALPELHTSLVARPELQPVYIGVCQTGVTVPDYYENLVMQQESGGNSCAMNPSGACGLFQALPCSKMGCTLYDVTCQEAWGWSYIIAVYGSSANAWSHEVNYGWY